MSNQKSIFGKLSAAAGQPLPLEVHQSHAGYYLGTWSNEGPFTRESAEYWRTQDKAAEALKTGRWTQRLNL